MGLVLPTCDALQLATILTHSSDPSAKWLWKYLYERQLANSFRGPCTSIWKCPILTLLAPLQMPYPCFLQKWLGRAMQARHAHIYEVCGRRIEPRGF